MRSRRFKLTVLACALTAVSVVLASSATAWDYDRSSYYNQIKRVQFYGNVTMGSGTTNNGWLVDSASDGNSVLVKTRHWFCFGSCNLISTSLTDDIENMTYGFNHYKNGTNKATTWACAQMGWPIPDSCTSTYSEG